MTELLPQDFRSSLGDADQEVIFDIALNWSMAQHPSALDFELLYTAVDAMATLQHSDLAALSFVPQRDGRGFVYQGQVNVIGSPEWARKHAGTLRERLKAAVHERVGQVEAPAAVGLFGPLFDQLFAFANGYNELHCFTTNYDRSVECIWEADLRKEMKANPSLVRAFRQVSPDRQLELDMSSYGAARESGVNTIKLYKLHGGLNWIRDGARIFESPANDYLRRNAVIYPLRKHTIDEPFRSLIDLFQARLSSLDILIVIGNSLRDDHLRNALIEGMRERAMLKVVILDPSASAIKDSFGDEFDRSIFPASAPFGDTHAQTELSDRLCEAAANGTV